MPAKVVDASVMAAWCFREPRAAEALAALRGFDLVAPVLLAFELTSIARRKSETYPGMAETIGSALRVALAVPIRWTDVDHISVLRLALNMHLSTYDASYLHLAQTLGLPLATFDEQLERASHRP